MSQSDVRRRRRVLHLQYHSKINKINIEDEVCFTSNHQQQAYCTDGVSKTYIWPICSVCEGQAHGYNFNAISCESCKAFFRRNALKPKENFQCHRGDGRCVLTETTRRKCKACRLRKCFEKGMRADWILTNEELQKKRQKVEENRRLRQTNHRISQASDESTQIKMQGEPIETNDAKLCPFLVTISLSSEYLKKIQQIQQAYLDSIRLTPLSSSIPSYPHKLQIDSPWDMINGPINIYVSRLISYFKLIPEFSSLNLHDKLVLIKNNIFTLVFIRSTLNYDLLTDTYHEPGTDDCIFSGKDFIQCFSFYEYIQSTRIVLRLLNASQNDRLITQILLLVMLFSNGSSIYTYTIESETSLEDILSTYNAQNVFIDLLWWYCENRFGFTKTIDIWLKLVTVAMDVHVQANSIRQYGINNKFVAEQLLPLMKSVTLIA